MNNTGRLFKCKDEELILLSTFTLFAFKRDLPDFSAFSPKYNTEFTTQLETLISEMTNLVEPSTEVIAKKLIKDRIATIYADCSSKMQYLEGYLIIAKSELPISKSDFGIVSLRTAINRCDTEALISNLSKVIQNIESNLAALKTAGMPDTFIADLKNLSTALTDNRQQQFQIDSNRKAIVQNNLDVLNNVFVLLKEIYAIGKILYYNSNKAKYKEYTFTELLKKVKQSTKTETIDTKTN